MFEALNDYMETLMKELGKTEESAQAKAQTHHDSFLKSRMGVYVGGNKYIDRLDGFVLSESTGQWIDNRDCLKWLVLSTIVFL